MLQTDYFFQTDKFFLSSIKSIHYMTIKQFEIFLALALKPNMRETAKQFFLSQAAVSSSLHAFEEELGAQLFDRVNNRLVLNEKGKLLQEKLIPIYAQIKEMLSIVNSSQMAGELCIGASTTLADYILPQIVYDLNKKYTDVKIHCEARNTAEIIQNVLDNVYDIGFVEGEVQNLKIKLTPLVDEKLVVLTADEEFASAKEYSIASLMDKEWLLREKGSGTREVFLNKINTFGIRPAKFMQFNHNKPITSLLSNKDTLACLSPYVVARELKAKELFIVKVTDIEFIRTLYQVERKDKVRSALTDIFIYETKKKILTECEI